MNVLSRHLTAGLDPVKLAQRVEVVCDAWQADALRSPVERLLLNIHRQGGKSTVAAILALHCALYRPRSLVLIVSPTQRQSTELFRKILAYYRQIGRPVNAEAENQLSLTLENGSRIIAVPGSEGGIRGYSVDLLIIDEASRVLDDLWGAVSPMLAVTHGRVVAMSTPWGKHGWWYGAATSRRWHTVTVPVTECPRLSPEWLAAERDEIGDFLYRQEYLCEFVDAAGQMFSSDDIDAIFSTADIGGLIGPKILDAIPAKTIDTLPVHPGIASTQRRMAIRRHNNAVLELARRSGCRHQWGPLVGDQRQCVHCGEDHR